MQEGEGGGEKSEQATPHRLKEAVKRGQVAKSVDLSRTATALAWLGILLALPGLYGGIADFAEAVLQQVQAPDKTEFAENIRHAASVMLKYSALPIGVVAIVGVLVTRLQTGHILSIDPILPKFSNLSPGEGFKRIFSMGSLFEVLKGMIKIGIIFGIVAFVIIYFANDILKLTENSIFVFAELDHHLHLIVLAITCGVLLAISAIDFLFQRFNFLRSLRMSKQEIRRERQTEEGDPHLRSQRKRLQRKWASGNARQSTRDASALVVNPTHIAVALYYNSDDTLVPLVTATGEGQLATLMRHDAKVCGVPIMRSVPLARKLYAVCEDDEEVPEDLFDAVAEVLAWADAVRNSVDDGNATYREANNAFDRLVEFS